MNAVSAATVWRKHQKKIRWAVILVLAYTVFGFLILPPIVKSVATRQLSKLLDRPVTIASLRLNPYVFSATVRGFLIRDRDGEPFVSWDEVYVNFQPTSIFAKAWAVKELRTTQPFVRLQINQDRSLNFTDLIEKFSKPAGNESTPKKPSPPPALRVDLLQISGARATIADLTLRKPFRRTIGPLEIKLNNFRTHPDNKNPYAFSGTTESGERFSWSGHFFLSPVRSQGEFSLENLELAKYDGLYQDLVKLEIEDGVVDVRTSYQVELSETTQHASISNLTVGVRSVKVKDRASGESVAELSQFKMSGASVDVWKRQAEIGSIEVSGGRLNLRRTRDAGINVLQLAKPADTATNVSGSVMLLMRSVTNVFAQLLSTTNHWQAMVRDIQVTNCAVRVEDLVNLRPVNLVVDEIHASVRNVSNLPGTNLTAQLGLRWNTNGSVRTEVTASVLPVAASIAIKLEQLELKSLDPYLEPFVDVLILRSRLGLDAKIRLHMEGTNPLPSVKFTGDLALEDMGAAELRTGHDMIRWKALRFSGLEAILDPPTLTARELAMDELFAHVVVETNGVINLLAAARKASTNAPPAARPTGKDGKAEKPASRPLVATNAVPVQRPIAVSIQAVVFTNGTLQFTDHSVSPHADITIGQLEGAVRGVSSRPDDRAELEARGKVEGTGGVEIKGATYPMFIARDTTMDLNVSGVDLHPTGPYVGRYLGYRLTKGKVGVNLKYTVQNGKVKGANLIKLDQFTLGEKVESPEALSLPIKLGIAILKDRNGLIDLDVPVEGSLSDPEFRLGKVITRAIVNVLTKIVTSPFAALGAVFGGGGEELSYQEFEPGSDVLPTAGREKLEKLVNGLYERPGLQLEIEGAVDKVRDGAALRRQKLEGELRLSKWQSLSKSARAETTPEQIPVTPVEFTKLIERKYQAQFSPEAVAGRAGTNAPASTNKPPTQVGTRPRPPGGEPVAKGAVVLRGEPVARAPKAEAQNMEEQVLGLMELNEADYAELATKRARRVRDEVLRSGRIAADRILLTDPAAVSRSSKGNKALLRLQ